MKKKTESKTKSKPKAKAKKEETTGKARPSPGKKVKDCDELGQIWNEDLCE